MNLTGLIARLSQLVAEHGDLPVHDTAHFLVDDVFIRVAEKDQFPEDWNMPEGYKFVQIGQEP